MSEVPDRGSNSKRKVDFLSQKGMSPLEQFGATMRASAVPANSFEGEYLSQGTYNSKGANLLKKVSWESRMRKEMDTE